MAPQLDNLHDPETWSDHNTQLVVRQAKGYLCNITLRAKVELPAKLLYDMLTSPENYRIFSNVKAQPYRKVLEDDGKGRQVVEVEHVSMWRFLCFSGKFSTRLIVAQDRNAGTINFRLAKPGMMKDFAGTWRLRPFTQKSLDIELDDGQEHTHSPKPSWSSVTGLLHTLSDQVFARAPQATLATLEQSVAPNVMPPPGLRGVIKGIAAKQVVCMMEDLQAEVQRIKGGNPTIAGLHLERYAHREEAQGHHKDHTDNQQQQQRNGEAGGRQAAKLMSCSCCSSRRARNPWLLQIRPLSEVWPAAS